MKKIFLSHEANTGMVPASEHTENGEGKRITWFPGNGKLFPHPFPPGLWLLGGGGGISMSSSLPLRPKNRRTGPERQPAQLSRRRGMANVICTVMEVWRGALYCLPWQELLSRQLLKFYSCRNILNVLKQTWPPSQITPCGPGRCK